VQPLQVERIQDVYNSVACKVTTSFVCLPYHSPGRDRFRWMDGEQKNKRTPGRYINPAPRTLQRASLAGVSQQYDTALITKLQMSADY